LHELDKTTSDVINLVQSQQRDNPEAPGTPITVPSAEGDVTIEPPANAPLTLPQLQRLRRQFIALNRQHTMESKRIKVAFVDYLNDQFQRE